MSSLRAILVLGLSGAAMLAAVMLRAETARLHREISRLDHEAETGVLALRERHLELARLRNPTQLRARISELKDRSLTGLSAAEMKRPSR